MATSSWLALALERLDGMAAALPAGARRGARAALAARQRSEFLAAVTALVEEVADRDGVTACFACHDGLTVAMAGQAHDDRDALSAMAQALSATAGGAAHRLLLGGVRQIVVVGATHKLALLGVSDLAIGVLAPSAVDLSTALASRSFDPKDPSDPQEPPCR